MEVVSSPAKKPRQDITRQSILHQEEFPAITYKNKLAFDHSRHTSTSKTREYHYPHKPGGTPRPHAFHLPIFPYTFVTPGISPLHIRQKDKHLLWKLGVREQEDKGWKKILWRRMKSATRWGEVRKFTRLTAAGWDKCANLSWIWWIRKGRMPKLPPLHFLLGQRN